ncbi:AI-2E family transporter [Enterococcus dispar]|uniref:AI-2E family transporter n=1 Tax=Enterococcus dispar TaxID=44009 RepID=UPI0021D42BEA|nr:AI-2E family transporter [Enterococcus dispar]MCU7356169.1 AI-2E family transporter [Enterococcus dispar]MDT2704738.1 AI-2E family transporter [Enterococcus dispar]
MLEKLKNSKIMFWSLELLILATLIFVSTKIDFIFKPIGTFFSTLFAPVLIAGFLYYLLNPIVNLLEKRVKLKRIYGIVLVFILLIGALVLIIGSVIPSLVSQITSLAESIPSFIASVEEWIREMARSPIFKQIDLQAQFDKLDISYGTIIQRFLSSLSNSIGSIVGQVANATMIIVTAPFILFYMLKDGNRLVPNVERFFPVKRRAQIVDLLGKLNYTLSKYISGQAIECVFVATFTFIGYLIIGVDYAFLFGVIAGVTNLIPYLGPYLGLMPAVLVTVFDSPLKALLCCVVVLIVQQLDGNIIYPNVIGKTLAIHPLTIILVLLVAGNIAGLLGIFLGVPFYAVCRVLVTFIVKLIKEDKERDEDTLVENETSKIE